MKFLKQTLLCEALAQFVLFWMACKINQNLIIVFLLEGVIDLIIVLFSCCDAPLILLTTVPLKIVLR